MIYSAFVPVLISVRILPVGCDSSDGSSAGTSAEGECAVWCCARAAVPGQPSGAGALGAGAALCPTRSGWG